MKGSLRESDSLKEPFTDFQRRKARLAASAPPALTSTVAAPRLPPYREDLIGPQPTLRAQRDQPPGHAHLQPQRAHPPTALPRNLIGRRRHPRTQRDQPPKPPAPPTATREPNQPRATQPRPANPTSHAHPKRNARNQPATRTPQLQPAHPTSHPPPNRSQRTQRARHPALPRTPIRSSPAVRGCLSRHLSRLERLIQLPSPPSHLAKRSQPVIRQRQNLRPRIMRRRPPGNEPPVLQPPAHISHRRRIQRDRLGQRGLIEPGIRPHRRQHRELRPRQHRVDMPIPGRQIGLV